MHRIFQVHHIPPDEVYAKDKRYRRFMYASEALAMEAEEKARKEQERKQQRKGGKR